MKKSDIKSGMHVVTNNGYEYVILNDVCCSNQTDAKGKFIMIRMGNPSGWMDFEDYDDNLCYFGKGDDNYTIKEVYQSHYYKSILKSTIEDENDKYYFDKIWERPKKMKMTKAEIEEALGYKIEII